MALGNFLAISTNHGLLGPCIKHFGMATFNPVVDNSLCVIINFWAGIKIFHSSLTSHVTLWLQKQAPLTGELLSALGHIIGFSHPNP